MYHFIVNPKSRTGNGLTVWNNVEKVLKQREILYQVYFTHYEFHAAKLAKQICETNIGTKHIIVLGGDGTVNEVINGIDSYQDILFGYIPSGSSNDLARSLGIPKDPIQALEQLLTSRCYRYYDHGIIQTNESDLTKKEPTGLPVNGRKFAVSTGIGFDASICYEALDSNIKRFLNKLKLGKLTYVAIAFKQLIKYQPCDAKLIIDRHKTIELKNIFFIASMIQPYEGGGFKMAPNANPRDQKLSVCAVYNISKLKGLLILIAILFKKQYWMKGVKLFDCETLDITTKEKLIVHTDGEFAGRFDHLSIRCTNEQIRMLL
jgi:YegS/Rv2252/BmrU family lipid kinase